MKSTTAERETVGSMMASAECAARSPEIQSADYTNPALRAIFDAITATIADCVDVTPATVATRLERAGEIERVGGQSALVNLAKIADVDNFDDHMQALIREAKRASVRARLNAGIEQLQDPDADLEVVGSATVADVEREVASRGRSRGTSSTDAVNEAIKGYIARSRNPRLPGTPTSIDSLNILLRMLQRNRLHVLGARPGVGKTAMALNFIEAAAVMHGVPCIIWSMEMPPEENTGRLITTRSNVSATVWQEGSKQAGDLQAFIRAGGDVARAPIRWGEATNLPGILIELAAWMRDPETERQLAEANSRHAAKGIDADFCPLAVIDHLHALPKGGVDEIKFMHDATGACKAAALRHKIPILLLAQLNRESAKDARPPKLTDFRGGGAIEEWADVGMLIDRDPEGENPQDAWLKIPKNRGGKVGKIPLLWEGHHQRYTERDA